MVVRNTPEDRAKLYFGDSLMVLDDIPENSIDMILTDPPYMISKEGAKIIRHNMRSKEFKRSKDISLDFGEWDHFESIEQYIDFTRAWVTKAFSKLKDGGWICIFFDKMKTYILDDISREISITPKNIYVWAKTNPYPNFRKVNFLSATEFIWCGEKGKRK